MYRIMYATCLPTLKTPYWQVSLSTACVSLRGHFLSEMNSDYVQVNLQRPRIIPLNPLNRNHKLHALESIRRGTRQRKQA